MQFVSVENVRCGEPNVQDHMSRFGFTWECNDYQHRILLPMTVGILNSSKVDASHFVVMKISYSFSILFGVKLQGTFFDRSFLEILFLMIQIRKKVK